MLQGYASEALQLDGEESEFVQRVIFQRIGGHLRLAQVRFHKAVGIDDEDAVGLQVADIDLQRRGIHGNQHIDGIARGVHVARGKMQLVTAHARQSAGRGANLGGEVREGRDVVAVKRDRIGELASGNLHAVAGIPGEANDRLIDLFAPVLGERRFDECRHRIPDPVRNSSSTFPPPQGARLNH